MAVYIMYLQYWFLICLSIDLVLQRGNNKSQNPLNRIGYILSFYLILLKSISLSLSFLGVWSLVSRVLCTWFRSRICISFVHKIPQSQILRMILITCASRGFPLAICFHVLRVFDPIQNPTSQFSIYYQSDFADRIIQIRQAFTCPPSNLINIY